jgi:hypothetical protein
MTRNIAAANVMVREANLRKATRAKVLIGDARSEVRSGKLRFGDAMLDERCQPMRVWRLVLSVPRVGPKRVERFKRELLERNVTISESKRIAALTTRQRDTLIEIVEGARQ